MLFISPPFGNYISLPHTKRIKGSYTLHPREGLLLQILKTLRFSFKYNGWINKIGLRNKGLQYGIDNYCHKTDILSIAIMEESEIKPILKILPETTPLIVRWPKLQLTIVNIKIPRNETLFIKLDLSKEIIWSPWTSSIESPVSCM